MTCDGFNRSVTVLTYDNFESVADFNVHKYLSKIIANTFEYSFLNMIMCISVRILGL